MRRRGNVCSKKKNPPIVVVCFGGALLCFCFISHTLLVVTLGVALIVLGIWLLRNS
ncbi:MAG: hypothetical protein FWF94_07680 [Oscillospiraceae bacterium]|nr:hypothetical protein [Oscillospiraceae bacterium]